MRLSDILTNGSGEDDWQNVEAAKDFEPLPAGKYICHIVQSKLETVGKNATPSYTLTFKVIEGDYLGRKIWHNIWLTEGAKPKAKRDLQKLGFTSFAQCELPIPKFIRCECKLVVHRDDNGNERNKLKTFDVIGIDKPEDDPFAPGAVASSPTEPAPTLPAEAATLPLQTQATEGSNQNAIPF